MSVLYLVRHGQASFGSDDYDRLSDLGREQGRIAGRFLAAQGVEPVSIIHGEMLRQRQTAEGILEGFGQWYSSQGLIGERGHKTESDTSAAPAPSLGFEPDPTAAPDSDNRPRANAHSSSDSATGSDNANRLIPDVDAGWNEYRAWELTGALSETDPRAKHDSKIFQAELERGCARWASGEHDADYTETYSQFTSRVERALDEAIASMGSGQSTIVVSSAGAIAWTAARLIGGGFDQWIAFNRVTINTGITKIITGRGGTSLVSFNDHGHLPPRDATYR